MFHLRDIARILNIESKHVKHHARTLEESGRSPWEVMGVRKVWTHWLVLMSRFASYFREHMQRPYQDIPPDWDANTLLGQTDGIFLLRDVCRLLPFTTQHILLRARKCENPKNEMGVWKNELWFVHLVDIAVFSPFIRREWRGS